MTALPLAAALLVAASAGADAPKQARARRQARAPAAAAASPLPDPAPPRAERAPGTGAVAYVTASRAYLDVGAEDGLAPGVRLELRRDGAAAATCTVEALAPHHATCTGATGARRGDRFAFTPEAAPDEAPAPKPLPPLVPEEELARRQAAVEAAPVALVEFKPAAGGVALTAPRARAVDVGFTHASFAAVDADAEHRESVDVTLRDVEAGAGVTVDVDARAVHWLRRRANPRFRPQDDTQLYLWQAQIGFQPGALLLSAGRVLPWAIPGATIFDGALAGARGRVGGFDAEAGAFGGLVPQPVTTAFTTDRSTGGVYWILGRVLGRGASLRQEGRLAVVHSPELGTRGEASLTARVFLRAVDLSAEAHLGAGGEETAPGALDAARVELTARPARGWSFGGGFRYGGLDWPQPFEPPAFPGRSRAADAFVRWDARPWLRIGITAGDSEDLAADLGHRWIGPEVTLPTLLGARGGLTVAYLEEAGWIGGRSAYAQLVARPWDPVRVLFRATWTQDERLAMDEHEVGAYASVSADLSRHVGLRVSLLGRGAISFAEEEGGPGTPWGFTGTASVFATY